MDEGDQKGTVIPWGFQKWVQDSASLQSVAREGRVTDGIFISWWPLLYKNLFRLYSSNSWSILDFFSYVPPRNDCKQDKMSPPNQCWLAGWASSRILGASPWAKLYFFLEVAGRCFVPKCEKPQKEPQEQEEQRSSKCFLHLCLQRLEIGCTKR